ncbi:MAG: ABC transporter ATP-binding protein [Hyphomicrobiaceae bacterium]
MSLIRARELVKRFGAQTAVDHVSLEVARGEVVGFLGPNGAGKSTTMRMITGFMEPDGGSSEICGHDVGTAPLAAKRKLGYLPEGAPAYADMSVADFLTFVGKIRGLSGQHLDDRLAIMADRINIAEVWNKPIEALSKGFKRRVGIAQALIHDPDVLILDEPTDGLDPNQKHEMRALIQEIAPNKAIVISTHILEEVEAVCSRAVIIAAGKVVADATPEALVARAGRQNRIRLTVSAHQPQQVIERLRPITADSRIEVIEQFNGATKLLIDIGEADGEPGTFAEAVRQSGLEVEDIGPWRPRLEDVFREITSTQRPS